MINSEKRIELLAPAGSIDALYAAVCGGADAVYLGLNHFNARRGAENFSLQNLREACNYAHLRNVAIYVALNIIIFEREISRALQMAADAYNAGADGFIVQDIGLAMLIRKHIPDARLHISTQMNIHNKQGIDAAHALGAKRITLSRELSLDEIKNLSYYAKHLGIEVETFCHGAICVSYSGQCMMSSMIGGRSANRGTCAQACRLNYQYQVGNWSKGSSKLEEDDKRGSYLLSPKDYCTVSLIPNLIEAGVASLKIEGRMKTPEYVYAVVSVYKSIIDRYYSGENPSVTKDEQLKLSQAFSRGFTTAYMTSTRNEQMMSTNRPNNRGVNIGRVKFANKNKVIVESSIKISYGDVLEVWTKRGRAVFVVDKTSTIQKSEKKGKPFWKVTLAVNQNKKEHNYVVSSDRVFRTRDSSASFVANNNEPKITINGFIKLSIGKPIMMQVWAVELPSKVIQVEGGVVETARTKQINTKEVAEHIRRTGSTSFVFDNIKIELQDGVGIGYSSLHQLRSLALTKLEESLIPKRNKVQVKIKKNTLSNKYQKQSKIFAIATNPLCARAAKRAGAEAVYVPALNYKRKWATLVGTPIECSSAGYPRNTILMMPTINHSQNHTSRESLLRCSAESIIEDIRPNKLYVDSIGDVFFACKNNIQFEVGPHVPVVNNHTISVLNALGCTKIWLSPELSLNQISNISSDGAELGITIAGRQELMITEHCILMNQGSCPENCPECKRRNKQSFLIDRKGYKFPVVSDVFGRSHIFNSIALDICHSLPELIIAGVNNFIIDTTLMTEEETSHVVGRATKALELAKFGKSIEKQGSFTTGHLFREVN